MGDYQFNDILTFDNTLEIAVGKKKTGQDFGIILHTTSRKLSIKLKDNFELVDWIQAFVDSILANPYCKRNRYGSFSPIRQNNSA